MDERLSSAGELETLQHDRTCTHEDRYESLRSLGRLLEYDLELQMNRNSKRMVLPVIKIQNAQAKHDRRRQSKPMKIDNAQDLKLVRRKMIQRILPDIEGSESGEKDESKTQISCSSNRSHDYVTKDGNRIRYDIVLDTTCSAKDDDNSSGHSNSQCSETIRGSIENLRERMARFDALKSVKHSVYADDFQQYLGARYLETHGHQARESEFRRANTSIEGFYENFHKTYDDTLVSSRSDDTHSYKLRAPMTDNHEIVGEYSLSPERPTSPELPSIAPRYRLPRWNNKQNKHRFGISRQSSRNRDYPLYSNIEYDFSKSSKRKGIPHHAATRAHMRYFNSHGLRSMLTDLKKTSESAHTVQNTVTRR